MNKPNNYTLLKGGEIKGGPNTYVGNRVKAKNVSSTKGVTGYKGEKRCVGIPLLTKSSVGCTCVQPSLSPPRAS